MSDTTQIFSLIKSLIEAVTPIITERADKEGIPSQIIVNIEHGKDGSTSIRNVYVPNYADLLVKDSEQILTLDAYQTLLDYVCSEESLASILLVDESGVPFSKKAKLGSFYSFAVGPILSNYFSKVGSIVFDETAFNSTVEDLRLYLGMTKLPYVLEAPLHGFKSDLDEIKLTDDVIIRRITDDDLKRVYAIPLFLSSSHQQTEVTRCTHILVCRFKLKRFSPNDSNNQLDWLVQSALTVLRLYKGKAIGINFRIIRPEYWIPLGWPFPNAIFPTYIRPPEYVIEESDVASLISLFQVYSSTSRKRTWELAVKRFNQATDRTETEDKLIDYWIAIEALLLGDKTELKFRAKLRIAKFVGDDPATRKQIYELIGESYDYRSKVVHGSAVNQDFEEVTAKTGEVIRKILNRWIDPGHTHDQAQLDLSLLD